MQQGGKEYTILIWRKKNFIIIHKNFIKNTKQKILLTKFVRNKFKKSQFYNFI